MGVSVALLAVTTALNVAAKRCERYILSNPHEGWCCTGEGTVTYKLLHHQCKYVCLQSATCKAYNYTVNEGACTRFTSPCPQVFSVPTMGCVVFRETPINQCYEWVPYSSGDPRDERMIATDNRWLTVARLQVSGNEVVGFFTTISKSCLASLEGTTYNSLHGYLCERLLVVQSCTIVWVPYTAGGPLPSHAVIGGVMANGDVPYVVKFNCIYKDYVRSISGYYTEGGTHAISSYGGRTRLSVTMMMMIVL